jgi:hypothetical protein
MQIDRVTITGADDSILPESLVRLTELHPYVEWGILLSRSQEGSHRFPSREWMQRLDEIAKESDLKLSGHLCGGWVRELVEGGRFTWLEERPEFVGMFQRIQLNFHAIPHRAAPHFFQTLRNIHGKQIIFQMDGVNEGLFHTARGEGINAVPLFDLSHGAGIVPEHWPAPIKDVYCGYAGGLGPDTLQAQLEKIAAKVGDRTTWIDMETRVRSNADQLFDLGKVEDCLSISEPWIGGLKRS